MKDLVSVVVPVYNMGESIEICVKSLMEQSYKNLEIILVDDGSKDNSFEKCNELRLRDSRITVFHTDNRGAGPARNTGIENAHGRYICFPDADDAYEIDAIEKMVDAMSEGASDFIIAGYKSLDENGKVIKYKTYKDNVVLGNELRENYYKYVGETSEFGINGAPWNKLYSLEIIRNNHIVFPPLRRHQDAAFIASYLCFVKNVHFINDVVYTHYLNDLRKEWYKYPVNYIDSVIGLRIIQSKTVLTWATNDKRNEYIVNQGYISNVIKAMELTFSPKFNCNVKERKAIVNEYIDKTKILNYEIPPNLGNYHRLVFKLLKGGHITLAISIMHLKVLVEKNGLLHFIK